MNKRSIIIFLALLVILFTVIYLYILKNKESNKVVVATDDYLVETIENCEYSIRPIYTNKESTAQTNTILHQPTNTIKPSQTNIIKATPGNTNKAEPKITQNNEQSKKTKEATTKSRKSTQRNTNKSTPSNTKKSTPDKIKDKEVLVTPSPTKKKETGEEALYETLLATAKGFVETNYNVDYRKLNGFKERMLYFLSSISDMDIWLEGRIDSIKKNTVVSTAIFESDVSSIYLDEDYYYRVKGRLKIKYGKETNKDLLKNINLKPETWYFRDLEILLTVGIDNNKWVRGEWTFAGCNYLNKYQECEGDNE